jgi:2-polyprenyl-3-methyl-5-hydroxy-6-metoxy-1,4-benzoquinol methylase
MAESNEIRFSCFGFDKKIVRCSSCQLVQLFPVWTKKELIGLYENYSTKKNFNNEKEEKDKGEDRTFVSNFFSKDDSVLEVGCGQGKEIIKLRRQGYNIIGVDKDASVCDGKSIFNYDFMEDEFCDFPKFDFIYSFHVLEHVLDPINFLLKIKALLKPNANFFLEIPNVKDPLICLYNNEPFSKFYWYPYHVFFFDKNSVTNMFAKISGVKIDIKLFQRYGILNHLRWILLGKPGNKNYKLPILDDVYSWILVNIFNVSDTIRIIGKTT